MLYPIQIFRVKDSFCVLYLHYSVAILLNDMEITRAVKN